MRSTVDLIADKTERVSLHLQVMREIRRCLTPFQTSDRPIDGDTVIADGVTVDSLTVMDLMMTLEDRFDVVIPVNLMAEVRTVDQLAQSVLVLHARR